MKTLPAPAQRRLVLLAQLLSQQKTRKITSSMIENLTGWSSSLIRRDISFLNFTHGVSNGYDVAELRAAICDSLGIENTDTEDIRRCCIVGLGRLGAALLDNSLFSETPFRITVGFDSSVNRTEVLRSTFPLYPLSRLELTVSDMGLQFAILCVKEDLAQETASRLVNSGILGIVNYSRAIISVPSGVFVENISPVTALINLSVRVAGRD
ncbi:MAG: CoA-binding protein [Treponema sp.]|nr:CoA-binding protein [Treponema sp.]